jgi:hypothetical protein
MHDLQHNVHRTLYNLMQHQSCFIIASKHPMNIVPENHAYQPPMHIERAGVVSLPQRAWSLLPPLVPSAIVGRMPCQSVEFQLD